MPPLSCTVRGCGAPLHQANRSFICDRGHSFDIARSGYVSLLQPQDRKSLDAGDSRAAVKARTDLLKAGVGVALLDAVVARAAALPFGGQPPVVVELGCGSGDTLGLLAAQREISGVGIDLSTAAASEAARRFAALTWVVANADRRLPLLDSSVDLVLSIHARRNPAECHRILRPDGFLVVAVPGASDLIELRELVQGEAVRRDRVQALVAEHDACFTRSSRHRRSKHSTSIVVRYTACFAALIAADVSANLHASRVSTASPSPLHPTSCCSQRGPDRDGRRWAPEATTFRTSCTPSVVRRRSRWPTAE